MPLRDFSHPLSQPTITYPILARSRSASDPKIGSQVRKRTAAGTARRSAVGSEGAADPRGFKRAVAATEGTVEGGGRLMKLSELPTPGQVIDRQREDAEFREEWDRSAFPAAGAVRPWTPAVTVVAATAWTASGWRPGSWSAGRLRRPRPVPRLESCGAADRYGFQPSLRSSSAS
jgi:hypothetical protein